MGEGGIVDIEELIESIGEASTSRPTAGDSPGELESTESMRSLEVDEDAFTLSGLRGSGPLPCSLLSGPNLSRCLSSAVFVPHV
mmetsp:Transcript_62406/g.185922  ORF Transcript_62406/g.185922 Transcript_62406/m.185922 type:complete len:84 (-) Transcript_62406:156-407(-)